MVLTSLSAMVFVAAFAAVRYFAPRHALALELLAAGGFGVSMAMFIAVSVTTPGPLVVKKAAQEGARRVHDRLPEEIRNRIPEEVRIRISREL